MECELGRGEEKLNTVFPSDNAVCVILLFVRFEDSNNASLSVLTPQNMNTKNWSWSYNSVPQLFFKKK